MKIHILYILPLFILSCQEKNNNNSDVIVVRDTVTVEDNTAEEAPANLNSFEGIVYRYNQITKNAVAKAEAANGEEANEVYEKYIAQTSVLIQDLNNKERQTLDNYHMYFYKDGEKATPPDSIQVKSYLLNKAGLEYRNAGEGMGLITTQPGHYYATFKKYVTPDYHHYLKLSAEHDVVPYSFDGALNISFKEVGDRVLDWENFITKYPESNLKKEAKMKYAGYQMDFLFGLNNTPAFNYDDGGLEPENKKVLEQFIREHPKSYTAELAKAVLNATNKNVTDIRQKAEKLQREHLAKL